MSTPAPTIRARALRRDLSLEPRTIQERRRLLLRLQALAAALPDVSIRIRVAARD